MKGEKNLKGVSEIVKNIVDPFLKQNDYYLYDIEFVKEGRERFLRVFIDSEDSITLEDCEKVSNYLSSELDRLDPIQESYYLEVSSPGIERVFKSDSDYKKYVGDRIQLNLYTLFEGQKIITGKLVEKNDDFVKLIDDTSEEKLEIPTKIIAMAKNIFEL